MVAIENRSSSTDSHSDLNNPDRPFPNSTKRSQIVEDADCLGVTMEIEMASEECHNELRGPTDFKLFPKLPPEIRFRVWEMHCPALEGETQILDLCSLNAPVFGFDSDFWQDSDPESSPVPDTFTMPALTANLRTVLAVHTESRIFALQLLPDSLVFQARDFPLVSLPNHAAKREKEGHGDEEDGNHHGEPLEGLDAMEATGIIRFDARKDIVRLCNEFGLNRLFKTKFPRGGAVHAEFKSFNKKIRNLVIPHGWNSHWGGAPGTSEYLLNRFPNLENLFYSLDIRGIFPSNPQKSARFNNGSSTLRPKDLAWLAHPNVHRAVVRTFFKESMCFPAIGKGDSVPVSPVAMKALPPVHAGAGGKTLTVQPMVTFRYSIRMLRDDMHAFLEDSDEKIDRLVFEKLEIVDDGHGPYDHTYTGITWT